MRVLLASEVASGIYLRGVSCVVIDAFRSGATLARAMGSGCPRALLFGEIEDLWAAKRADPALKSAWVAGERGGKALPGFDFGNSPFDVPDDFQGRPLLFSTTNGVRTIEQVLRQEPFSCFLAGFVNAKATVLELERERRPIAFICSGTDGAFALEDFACAGYLVNLLQGQERSDSAWAAWTVWEAWKRDPVGHSHKGRGGRNLWALDFGRDVEYCVRTDIIDRAVRIHKDPLRAEA